MTTMTRLSQRNLEIIDFIHRRFRTDCSWTTGNCYYFAVILTARFPELRIVYLPVAGHFMVHDAENHKYYDFYGAHDELQVSREDHPMPWDELCESDPKYCARLFRDCIR